jgi:hypothetical protein
MHGMNIKIKKKFNFTKEGGINLPLNWEPIDVYITHVYIIVCSVITALEVQNS